MNYKVTVLGPIVTGWRSQSAVGLWCLPCISARMTGVRAAIFLLPEARALSHKSTRLCGELICSNSLKAEHRWTRMLPGLCRPRCRMGSQLLNDFAEPRRDPRGRWRCLGQTWKRCRGFSTEVTAWWKGCEPKNITPAPLSIGRSGGAHRCICPHSGGPTTLRPLRPMGTGHRQIKGP